MSGKHFHPIRCCDLECALVNHCSVGGVQCDGCGGYFCATYISNTDDGYLCDECLEERESKREEYEDDED